MRKYVNAILTAHVMKRLADPEVGLDLLLRHRVGTFFLDLKTFLAHICQLVLPENEPRLVEDAVKCIIFLVEVDRLFVTNDAVNCALDAVQAAP